MRYTLFLLVLSLTMVLSGQSRMDKFEPTYQKSKTLILSKNYNVHFNMVYDGQSRAQIDNKSNYLSINQSTSKGSVSTLAEDNTTVNLNGSIENYNVNFDDNRKLINISYDLINNGKRQFVELAIKPSGNAILLLKKDSGKATSWIGNLAD